MTIPRLAGIALCVLSAVCAADTSAYATAELEVATALDGFLDLLDEGEINQAMQHVWLPDSSMTESDTFKDFDSEAFVHDVSEALIDLSVQRQKHPPAGEAVLVRVVGDRALAVYRVADDWPGGAGVRTLTSWWSRCGTGWSQTIDQAQPAVDAEEQLKLDAWLHVLSETRGWLPRPLIDLGNTAEPVPTPDQSEAAPVA